MRCVDSPSLVVRLGPFEVSTESSEVAAFRAALGPGAVGAAPEVPLTYPIRWLASAAIQSELRKVAGDEAVLLVHEAQSFSYRTRLETNQTYSLDLTLRRESGREERAILRAVIRDAAGAGVAEVETVLRLVRPPAGDEP
jgi:hypothetical protein